MSGCSDGANTNIGYKFVMTIDDKIGGKYFFELGADFSAGGAIFVDGAPKTWEESSMYWGGMWSTSASLKLTIKLSPGEHTVTFYGADN